MVKFTSLKIKLMFSLFLVLILCCVGGVLFLKTDSVKVSAYSTSASDSFDLYNGMSISTESARARLLLSVTDEELEQLNVENYTGPLGWVEYSPCDNIVLFRVKNVSTVNYIVNNRYQLFYTMIIVGE